MQRRQFVTVAGLAGLGAVVPAGATRGQEPASSGRSAGPVLGCQRGPTSLKRLQHFKRHGVDHICGFPDNGADPASWTAEALTALRDRCAAQGISLDMVEFPMLSSASIDTMTPQHEMNPRLVAGLGLDMVALMRTLKQVGYQHMVMPDHLPQHADDPGGDQAFAFGYGYIKALLQSV